jgi:hypothetical protein
VSRSFYPRRADRRRAVMARDASLVLAVAGFALLGWVMYYLVERVSVVATGVEEAGLSVQEAFDQVAATARTVPLVGGDLAEALSGAGAQTGGQVAELGAEGRGTIQRTAVATGLVTFVGPSTALLALVVPQRLRLVRRLRAGPAVLAGAEDPERRRLLAMRAAFGLPPEDLVRHTADPLGDLAAGRHDALVAALAEDLGLDAPAD